MEKQGIEALSKRQTEVLELVSDGLTNAQIAKRLCVHKCTVSQHMSGIFEVLQVDNRTSAARCLWVYQLEESKATA